VLREIPPRSSIASWTVYRSLPLPGIQIERPFDVDHVSLGETCNLAITVYLILDFGYSAFGIFFPISDDPESAIPLTYRAVRSCRWLYVYGGEAGCLRRYYSCTALPFKPDTALQQSLKEHSVN
jgi:hypothetical protein